MAFLVSPAGQDALSSVGGVEEDGLLPTLERLRLTLTARQASAVVETVRLRRRARSKFDDPSRMLFTADGLEQASGSVAAASRAAGFASVGLVADLGCGIGGDARELAAVAEVVAVERDESTVAVAAHNLRDLAHVVRGDALRPPCDVRRMAVHIDPSRRATRGRVFDPDAHQPPFDDAVGVARLAPRAAIKTAPGLPHDRIPADAAADFVSVGGELKECVLWFGAGREPSARSAVLADADARLTAVPHRRAPLRPIGAWLHEPDPAVIRAELVANLAVMLDCGLVDPHIAYLTGDRAEASPFVRSYRVESVLPFQLKRLRAHLRSLGVGTVTIKKRGSPIRPEDLRRRLDLAGDEHRVVILTRIGTAPVAIVAFEPPHATVRAQI